MSTTPKWLFMTIAKRLWLLAACATAGIAVLTIVFMVSERGLIMDERQASVRQAVETAHGILTYYQDQAAKGTMPEADAKRHALAAIKGLRYNGDEYFWINDMQPQMIMHPFKPELDGKNIAENKDPNGKRLFVEMVDTVKAHGAGYVFYVWPKPGSDDPVDKVSYVKGFAPWGWIIGSGVYLQSVQATFISRLTNFSLGSLALAGILLAICLGIARSITKPLNRAVRIAQTVAGGDLTSTIESGSRDETGQLLEALRHMNESLARIVGEVRAGTDTITTASREIADGSLDLSSRTEEQASSLEETASSMEELASTVKQNADNARQANQLAASASDVAVKGGEVVSQVVTTMHAINDSSRKIVDIIAVIDGIAFQTNILALNAAVEAARAGEQGRGFAVVAAEVRSLAQRSAAAAREVKTLISDSVDRVAAGTQLVEKAGSTMQDIVDSVKRVTDIMGEIAMASNEQTSGIGQINQAIMQMDDVTQQNAALVEQEAAAAESLHDQAGHLSQLVSVFKLEERHVATVIPLATEATRRAQEMRGRSSSAVSRLRTAPQGANQVPAKRVANTTASKELDWEEF